MRGAEALAQGHQAGTLFEALRRRREIRDPLQLVAQRDGYALKSLVKPAQAVLRVSIDDAVDLW
jgi:hypothetical protein